MINFIINWWILVAKNHSLINMMTKLVLIGWMNMNVLIMNWVLLVVQFMCNYIYIVNLRQIMHINAFLWTFLWSKNGDELQEDFAKFSYKLNLIVDLIFLERIFLGTYLNHICKYGKFS
jgi:hypothetical protein